MIDKEAEKIKFKEKYTPQWLLDCVMLEDGGTTMRLSEAIMRKSGIRRIKLAATFSTEYHTKIELRPPFDPRGEKND